MSQAKTWSWRGDIIPANHAEVQLAKAQLESECFPKRVASSTPGPKRASRLQPETNSNTNIRMVPYHELLESEKQTLLRKRLKEYSKRTYKKTHIKVLEERVATVCMQENPFYINTVRAFCDRRYTYKECLKVEKSKLDQAIKDGRPPQEI
jgi:DNA polymerase epsilon subunit 1